MFASGNTDKLVRPSRKLGGLDALRTSTNEAGVTIPWFCGRARLGITYISRMFDIQKTKVQASKKGAVTAYKYAAGFAGLVSHGPIDRIFNVITQDDLIWEEDTGSPTERPGAGVDYVDLTIESLGTLRVYWGTETQTADGGLVYEGITHPAYRGFAYVRSLNWYLGQFAGGDVPAGNFEMMVGRYPEPSWWVLPSVKIGQDINPAAAIWDLLQPGRRVGIPEDLIDTDSLLAVAERLDSEAIGLSPVFTSSRSIRESLLSICQNFDGYFRQSTDGKLYFGLNRAPVVSLPIFAPADMTERVQISTGSWTQTASGSQVRFRNGELYLNDDVASSFDSANFSVTGRGDSPSVDRPFVTDPDLAQTIANAMAQRNGIPQGSGVLRLRKSSIGDLQAGDQFEFHYPMIEAYFMKAIVTAIEYPEPGKPEVVIEWEQDNTQTMQGLYSPRTYTAPPSATKTPIKPPIQFGFELLGVGAPTTDKAWFGFCAVAPTLVHNGFFIWREFPDASSDYVDQVDEFSSWTPALYLYGGLLSSGASTFEVFLGPEAALTGMVVDGDGNFDSFPTADINAGKVYIALDSGGFGGDVEIVRVTSILTGGGTGRYQIYIDRGQLGTSDVNHDGWTTVGVQSACCMFNVDELAEIGIDAPFATEKFLIQPSIAGRRADITTLDPFEIARTLDGTPPPQNLRAFGDRLNPSYTTGIDILIEWDATVYDPDRLDLVARTSTELRIYDAPGTTLKATIAVGATLETYTWANAALVTALGSETNFHVRGYQKLDGAYSSTYVEITVRKI